MQTDIYIRERSGSREIRVPWLPASIKCETGEATVATYDIMGKGEVSVPTGTSLGAYSWESELPGENRQDPGLLRGEWKDPKEYHNILVDWKEKGTPLTLLVTGYPINADVYLTDYVATAAGAFGDISYEVKFVQERAIKVTSATVDTEPPEDETERSEPETTSYTIKSGDNLWKIAQKFLGKGSRWKEIYELNKDIIESVAKERWKRAGKNRDSENGHWIFPGTVIKIPQK